MVALDDVTGLSDDEIAGQNRAPSPKSKPSPKRKGKKTEAKPKASPKKKTEEKAFRKRPAAAVPSGPASPTKMKKPAAKGRTKDPDHISTCKSMYKNGVFSIKLFSKEVIRVSSLHWCINGFKSTHLCCINCSWSTVQRLQVKPDPKITDEELDTIAVSWTAAKTWAAVKTWFSFSDFQIISNLQSVEN